MGFPDHFSGHAALYASARPQYPPELFRFIASIAPGTARAWDCATGNGQAALGLAGCFREVEATDASAGQIAQATPAAGVRYSVQAAEKTAFADASFDAVCVAQALHWFDTAQFFAEVRRVLRPGGVLVATGYNWFQVAPEFDAEFRRVVLNVIEQDWPPQNRLVWNGYRDVPFPFATLPSPALEITVDWNFEQLLAFVHSWSATRRHIERAGPGHLDAAALELARSWGDAGARRRVTMPLCVLAGRAAR